MRLSIWGMRLSIRGKREWKGDKREIGGGNEAIHLGDGWGLGRRRDEIVEEAVAGRKRSAVLGVTRQSDFERDLNCEKTQYYSDKKPDGFNYYL